MSHIFIHCYDETTATTAAKRDIIVWVSELERLEAETKDLYQRRDDVEARLREKLGSGFATLDDGRVVSVKDNFKNAEGEFVNSAYRPARVPHYSIAIAKPKAAKKAKE